MFKGLFSGLDHPLANRRILKESLAVVAGANSRLGVQRAIELAQSLGGMEQHASWYINTTEELENATVFPLRRLTREYLALLRTDRMRASQLSSQLANLHNNFLGLYVQCVQNYTTGTKGSQEIKGKLHVVCARILSNAYNLLKWRYLGHCTMENDIWQPVGMACLVVTKQNIMGKAVQIRDRKTSVSLEYIKLILLQCSSPENLEDAEMDFADRVIDNVAPMVALLSQPQGGETHCVNATSGQPPARLQEAMQSPSSTTFYINAKAAAAHLSNAVMSGMAGNGYPSGLDVAAKISFSGTASPTLVNPVLEHLIACWS